MVKDQLKRAEPTYEDVMEARQIGEGHPYWSESIRPTKASPVDASQEATNYRQLLEILFCRERQLEIAVSLLSEKNRAKVGV